MAESNRMFDSSTIQFAGRMFARAKRPTCSVARNFMESGFEMVLPDRFIRKASPTGKSRGTLVAEREGANSCLNMSVWER